MTRGLVSQVGAVLLWETMRVTGLGRGLSQALGRTVQASTSNMRKIEASVCVHS
jgi:hypothetical protein